jgi:hypothetical protein
VLKATTPASSNREMIARFIAVLPGLRVRFPAAGLFGLCLALVYPPHKPFGQFLEPFRDRFRKVDMRLDFPPDEFQKLTALRGLLPVAPCFHDVLPFFL